MKALSSHVTIQCAPTAEYLGTRIAKEHKKHQTDQAVDESAMCLIPQRGSAANSDPVYE